MAPTTSTPANSAYRDAITHSMLKQLTAIYVSSDFARSHLATALLLVRNYLYSSFDISIRLYRPFPYVFAVYSMPL